MTEKEPAVLKLSDMFPEGIVPVEHRLRKFVGQLTHYYNLDYLSSEVLGKFANISLHIKRIPYDFEERKVSYSFYVFGHDENGKRRDFVITKDDYKDKIDILVNTNIGLYKTYIKSNSSMESAAREIQEQINNFFR